MPDLRWLVLVLASCATADVLDVPWQPGPDDTAADGEVRLDRHEVFSHLEPVGTYYDVEIRSDVAIDNTVIEKAARVARKAYTFDRALLGFDARPEFDPPFVIGLASAALVGTHNGACTLSVNDIQAALVDFVSSDKDGIAHYALAHELTHMTMFRMAPHAREQAVVPAYLFEGIATSVGLWFNRQSGLTSGWPFDAYRSELAAVTRATAGDALAHFRLTSDYRGKTAVQVGRDEHIGGLFVEYLRAHVAIDTHHRFGRAFERIRDGATIDEAMTAEFGSTLGQLEAQYIEFIAATETDPTSRFAGTVLAR